MLDFIIETYFDIKDILDHPLFLFSVYEILKRIFPQIQLFENRFINFLKDFTRKILDIIRQSL